METSFEMVRGSWGSDPDTRERTVLATDGHQTITIVFGERSLHGYQKLARAMGLMDPMKAPPGDALRFMIRRHIDRDGFRNPLRLIDRDWD